LPSLVAGITEQKSCIVLNTWVYSSKLRLASNPSTVK